MERAAAWIRQDAQPEGAQRVSQQVVDILVRRDGMVPGEAEALVADVKAQLNSVLRVSTCNPILAIVECEEIVADMLGLEPDYLEELLP